MIGKLQAGLMVVAVLALAVACDAGGVAQPAGSESVTRVINVVKVRQWPDNWPVPPLPAMSLQHEAGLTWGAPHRYCWRFDGASDRVCEEYYIWSRVYDYPEVDPGEQIPVIIDADTRPNKMFAQVYTRPGGIMVGGLRHLSTGSPRLDIADLGPGVYNVRLIGYWQDNEVSYEFGLSIPGVVELTAECAQTVIGGDPTLVLGSLDDSRRTAPDMSNSAGCKFNKPIARVSMTLHNNNFGPYTETFRIDPPSVELGFPLREGFSSERTGDLLPAGEYSRRVVAITEDGDEWVLYRDVVTLMSP